MDRIILIFITSGANLTKICKMLEKFIMQTFAQSFIILSVFHLKQETSCQ
ncbi:hypothetical protein WQG_3130 [Bibersteinia trehalosi USDA-ARS-USMARC-192]|nr:hypothetical protein WQG_3130 [Bibersteinia trehalosi USDA-ARS-USMARC-192]